MEAQPASASPSSSSSCSTDYNIMPLSSSPVWTEFDKAEPLQAVNQEEVSIHRSDIKILRFMDLTANGGMRWEDVEDQFDRLAITQCQPEPVIKWSDFGLCVGMKQSQEFANQLLRALRKSKDCNLGITKAELQGYWCRMTDPCFNSRMQIFFDMCDRKMQGRITEIDIKQTIILSATTNKLYLTPEEAEDYAASVMELLDTETRGYIELPQFETLLKMNLSNASFSDNPLSIIRDPCHNFDQVLEPNSKIEIMFRSYWRRAWIILLWLIISSALFTWKFMQYRHRAAFQVMGYCVSSAKGAAETLKFNMALVLLPVCRNTITWLRRNRSINSIIPFNDTINFHKLIAGGIIVGVIIHGGCHLACDLPRISDSDHVIFGQTIASGFGYHQPSYFEILSTKVVASGIGMVILMAIAFSLATTWPRRGLPSLPKSIRNVTGYNTFWYSHHLFIPVYALLIFHSMFLFLTNNVTEKTTWIYIAIPVLLYTGERVFRAIRSGFYETEMSKASIYPGKVLSLKLHKPKGFKYLSGMYIFIQCPQISPFEWHPFSLTSGPKDDHLSVHIRSAGDWSYQVYCLFQEATLSGLGSYPKVHIDGPYGAASEDHVKYDITVLIGLGIGATPFIGILKDIVNGAQNSSHCDHRCGCRECSSRKSPLKAYLFWVTREQSSFEWFRDIMNEISNSSEKQSVVEMHNFLTCVYQDGDARSVLISAIQELHYAKTGIDFVSRTPVRTHFARPNWSSIFSELACRHTGGRIGVFYCGASTLAKELEGMCTNFSTKTSTRFVFHKENY
ncbi:respiratory burst oxidase homolog protein A-like [Argentina anserina]|uniref:respiratory burst oxidase homolog protein A-like n=1 Tax=Argentina anserina TaxID=57926 RepID=UPI0021764EEC|nr:respiratory burst oxidase homolog protein A-like [Potentilla anserina]